MDTQKKAYIATYSDDCGLENWYKEENDRIAKQEKPIRDELKKTLTKYKYDGLMDFIGDCGSVELKGIIGKEKVSGDKQDEGYWFKYIFIRQSVGYICDDYNGTIFIPLGNKKYLWFKYSC